MMVLIVASVLLTGCRSLFSQLQENKIEAAAAIMRPKKNFVFIM